MRTILLSLALALAVFTLAGCRSTGMGGPRSEFSTKPSVQVAQTGPASPVVPGNSRALSV